MEEKDKEEGEWSMCMGGRQRKAQLPLTDRLQIEHKKTKERASLHVGPHTT